MGIEERLKGALAALRGERKTAQTVGVPAVIQRLGQRAEGLPKPTPVNLRKLAESPVARKAINTIKDRIACMDWAVREKGSPRSTAERRGGKRGQKASCIDPERSAQDDTSLQLRMEMARRMFEAPNPQDSFRSFIEQVLEDVLVGGFGAFEMEGSRWEPQRARRRHEGAGRKVAADQRG